MSCIEKTSLGPSLLPKIASDIGYNVTLLQLLSAYQKNPGTDTYQAVQNFLIQQRKEKQIILNCFNNDQSKFRRLDLNILDYEDNLLWSTAPLKNQDKYILLYQASNYSNSATEGAAYKEFEDGSVFSLAWVSGAPLFLKGGALRIGSGASDSFPLCNQNGRKYRGTGCFKNIYLGTDCSNNTCTNYYAINNGVANICTCNTTATYGSCTKGDTCDYVYPLCTGYIYATGGKCPNEPSSSCSKYYIKINGITYDCRYKNYKCYQGIHCNKPPPM